MNSGCWRSNSSTRLLSVAFIRLARIVAAEMPTFFASAVKVLIQPANSASVSIGAAAALVVGVVVDAVVVMVDVVMLVALAAWFSVFAGVCAQDNKLIQQTRGKSSRRLGMVTPDNGCLGNGSQGGWIRVQKVSAIMAACL